MPHKHIRITQRNRIEELEDVISIAMRYIDKIQVTPPDELEKSFFMAWLYNALYKTT